jgi:hypothetical protein
MLALPGTCRLLVEVDQIHFCVEIYALNFGKLSPVFPAAYQQLEGLLPQPEAFATLQ